MAAQRFQVLLEWDPDDRVWVTYVPALNHLSTYGETRQDALENTQEAILGYLEAADKDGIPAVRSGGTFEVIDLEVATA